MNHEIRWNQWSFVVVWPSTPRTWGRGRESIKAKQQNPTMQLCCLIVSTTQHNIKAPLKI